MHHALPKNLMDESAADRATTHDVPASATALSASHRHGRAHSLCAAAEAFGLATTTLRHDLMPSSDFQNRTLTAKCALNTPFLHLLGGGSSAQCLCE